MTNKEKEKLFTQTIKQLSKKSNWKFKSYFTFKLIDDFFFESTFYSNPKQNRIWGWVAFKPYSLDDKYWEITEMPENKKMPLSFRADAAFKVSSHPIYRFDVLLENGDNPENEIADLIENIDSEVINIRRKISTIEQFLDLLLKADNNPSVEILVCMIDQNEFEKAIEKIRFYRENQIKSGFRFGDKDFYDLAEEFCKKELGLDKSFIRKLGNRVVNIFKN